MVIQNISFESGSIVVTDDGGRSVRHDIANVLRAADIPVLTIDKLTVLTTLAQLVVVLVKTLIERGVLDESFEDGYDLQYIVDTLESDLRAEW